MAVVGAGHNGLTAAALLARRGRKVVVLEQRDRCGGLAAAEEFHPGYSGGGLLHDSTLIRPAVIRELRLETHGLRIRQSAPDRLALGPDRSGLLLAGDVGRAQEAISTISDRDAAAWVRFRAFVSRVRGAALQLLDAPPLDIVRFESIGLPALLRRAAQLRRLGRRDLSELLRIPPMAVADWLAEWFESDLLRATLALDAVEGTYSGPRAPGSAAGLLRRECLGGAGVHGGGPALVAALEHAARAAGVVVRTGSRVARLVHEAGSVRGVTLDGGETIAAARVAASCDPRQVFGRLLPPGSVSTRLAFRLRHFRCRGATAHLLLALDRPPEFSCLPGTPVERAHAAGSLDEIERAFDALKYREIARRPVLDLWVPTVDAPELAPDDHAVLSVLIHGTPYDLEGGWDATTRERLADRTIESLEAHCPGISGTVVGRRLRSPADLEATLALPSGHLMHGEQALDQLLIRPAPECCAYRTPLDGLFLCGSGSHPGGGLTCGPGALAAAVIGA